MSRVWFENYYECPCGHRWYDEHDCQCDDRCPECNTSCSPTSSRDATPPEDNVVPITTNVTECLAEMADLEAAAKHDFHVEDMVRSGLSLDQARAVLSAIDAYTS